MFNILQLKVNNFINLFVIWQQNVASKDNVSPQIMLLWWFEFVMKILPGLVIKFTLAYIYNTLMCRMSATK